MPEYGILDRLRDFVRSRRFMWIITIALAVVLFLYMLFVTLIFNPFEASLGDTATIVPSNSDYFVRWRKAGDQFGDFPEPKVWDAVEASTSYGEARDAGAMREFGAGVGIDSLLTSLDGVSAYLPIGLSLKDDFLTEVVVAGKGEMHFDSRFEGMVMLRGSFKVKMGVAMLGFGFVRDKLPEGVQFEELDDDIYKLPQFEPFGFQDAYLGRVKDVIILTSRLNMIAEAKDLDQRAGQDSLAQASKFRDNVTAYLGPDENPIETFLRWDKIGNQVGRWPNPNSESMATRFIGRLFDTSLLRFLAGYVQLEERLEMRFSGDLDLSAADSFQESWLEGNGVGAQRIKDYAAMTPAKSFFFSTFAGDPGKVLMEGYDLMAGDLRQSMDEAVAQSGQYQGMAHLLREIGGVYKPGLAVILHENNFPAQEGDPAHDDTPVPLFAVMGKVRDMEAYNRVYDFLRQNWAEFVGRDSGQATQSVILAGGAKATSFVSRIIPGTGEIVLLYIPSLETLVVTNSARFGGEINKVAFIDRRSARAEREQLIHQDTFIPAVEGSANGAHLFLWMDPGVAREYLEQQSVATAEEQFRLEKEASWRELRPREEQRLRQEMFEGRTNLNGTEEAQLLDAVDRALLAADAGSATRVPELREADRRAWLPMQVLDWFSFGLKVNRRHAEVLIQADLGG